MTAGPASGPSLPLTLIPVLQANAAQHALHLAHLADTLRSAGLDEAAVQGSLRTVMASYAEELQSTVRSIIGSDPCNP